MVLEKQYLRSSSIIVKLGNTSQRRTLQKRNLKFSSEEEKTHKLFCQYKIQILTKVFNCKNS